MSIIMIIFSSYTVCINLSRSVHLGLALIASKMPLVVILAI